MLIASGLRVRFADTVALDGMDLTVEPGEVAGLIGHNGAGKSTFVAVACGLVRADAGTVTVAGADVARQPRRARAALGVAPQELALYPGVTVREHLRLFGRLAGLRGRDLREAVDRTVTAMALTDVVDRPAGLLSGGQRRRAHTATALLHRPRVALLDEPTAGADPGTREALLAAVRDLARDGAAVCYATHYLPELDVLGATVAVLAHGRTVARGTRAQLLAALPGEVVVELDEPVPARLVEGHQDRVADGAVLRVVSHAPAAALAAVLAGLGPARVRSAEVRGPTLDELYRALTEASRAA